MAGSVKVEATPAELAALWADVQAQEAELRKVCRRFGRGASGVYAFTVEEAVDDFNAARRAYDLAAPEDDLPF